MLPVAAMFGPLGFPELLFILVLALLIFGPKRLPEVGRTIGKGMAQFRKATTDLKRTIETEISLEEEPRRQTERLTRPGRPAASPEIHSDIHPEVRSEIQMPDTTAPVSVPVPEPVPVAVQPPHVAVEAPPAAAADPAKSQPS